MQPSLLEISGSVLDELVNRKVFQPLRCILICWVLLLSKFFLFTRINIFSSKCTLKSTFKNYGNKLSSTVSHYCDFCLTVFGDLFFLVVTEASGGGGGGGGGVLNKFLYKEAPPWGPTPTDYLSNRLLFMSTFFWSKK